jgi:hypothetical protein
MKITKRQLKRIIRESIDKQKAIDDEFARSLQDDLDALSGNDPRLDDPDDLSLGEETLEKMVIHLQALNDLATSEAGRRTIGGKKEAEQIKALLPWAQDYLAYWKS